MIEIERDHAAAGVEIDVEKFDNFPRVCVLGTC
jgi:hypothetical protein